MPGDAVNGIVVAQNCILPYRGFSIRQALEYFEPFGLVERLAECNSAIPACAKRRAAGRQQSATLRYKQHA